MLFSYSISVIIFPYKFSNQLYVVMRQLNGVFLYFTISCRYKTFLVGNRYKSNIIRSAPDKPGFSVIILIFQITVIRFSYFVRVCLKLL